MLVVVLGMLTMKIMSPLIDELLLPWVHGGQPQTWHDEMQRAS